MWWPCWRYGTPGSSPRSSSRPLLLFVAVPGAYFLFNGAKFTGLKDTLINCGYPLIERFPLMLFTSAAVLLIGMARWYYAMWSSVRTPRPPPTRPVGPQSRHRTASVA